MRISTRLGLAALAPALLGIAGIAALLYSHRTAEEGRARIQDSHRILIGIADLGDLVRSYLLLPGERPLQQFAGEYDRIAVDLATLPLAAGEPQHRRARLAGHLDSMKSILRRLESIHEIELDGGQETARAEARERLAGQLLVRSRGAMAEAMELEGFILREVAATQRYIGIVSFTLLIGILVPLTVTLVLMMRRLAGSLAALRRGTERLGAGALDSRIALAGRDELAELAAAIDRMAGQLAAITVSRDQLGREVAERQRAEEALRLTAADLERSNRDLQQFAYVASHDLQEPLRMIGGFVRLLAERYGERLGEDGREYVEFAVDGARRMQQLIDDLLAYSRVGTRGEPPAPIDAREPLDRALALLRGQIEECGGRIEVEPLPAVLADGAQLAQLFQNLIGNALKFRSEAPPEIRIGARRQDGEVLFSVADNGIGMEPQYSDRIFVIFQRLHGRDDDQGTGIGLAICKRIVERHNGRIWVESRPGEGSTFFFNLPAAGQEAK